MPRLSGHITLVSVGKLRRPHWITAQEDYQKRLRRYTDFQLIEVKDVVGQGYPDRVAVQKEGEQLLKAAETATRRIALTHIGVQRSSPQLASYLNRQVQLFGHLAFIMGGSLGFSEEVLDACHDQMSLSTLTFPHEMARVIFLEQLYRACTIINGEKYHK